MSLSNKALLVSLTVSQWSARKYDRRESQAVAAKHGTQDGVARVNKALLPFAESLEKVHKLTGSIRTEYYKRTLPWTQEGVQIIKADGYMDFTQVMREQMSAWWQAVDEFVKEYPDLCEAAKVALNGLWRSEDYPDASAIRSKFNIDVIFTPVPEAGDWRVSLSDDEIARLEAQVSERVTSAQAGAMREAWRRVYDLVQHAHDRLSDPQTIFRNSLVENARELCTLLPSLNIADDPALEAMRYDIEGALAQHDPEVLRHDPVVRSDSARKLADLMRRMGPMYAS